MCIRDRGIDDVAVRFSRCCSPVPGDEIVGFVTRGRGVSIHRTDCVNIINLPEDERVLSLIHICGYGGGGRDPGAGSEELKDRLRHRQSAQGSGYE